jgi:toxin FitB
VSGWLVDTNVLSELRRRRPEEKVVSFVNGQPLDRLFVSTVTLAEIRFGIELLTDASRRSSLNAWLANTVRPMFERRTLGVDEDVLLEWRLLLEEGRKSGHTYSEPDAMIAAIARRYAMCVVTRDPTHYRKAAVPVFNPWTDPVPPEDDATVGG